jgi:putative flippase GtrA
MYTTASQFFRYAVVGLASNVVLYLLYLLATGLGIGHKLAMSALYLLGVLWTFALNRGWSFGHQGRAPTALLRYLSIYLLGYIVNWLALYVLVDHFGWPHQWVQGYMILALAIAQFLTHKYWVFR